MASSDPVRRARVHWGRLCLMRATGPLHDTPAVAAGFKLRLAHRRGHFVRRLPAAVMATLVGVVGQPAAAAAPAPFVALKYDVDPDLAGCPFPAEFKSKVTSQLGYDPFLPEATLVVNARVWQGEGGFEGALDWGRLAEARLGERRFSSKQASCHALIPAMVFALSVQIQIMAVEAEVVSSPDAMLDADGGGARPSAVAPPAATPTPDVTAKSPEVGFQGDGDSPAWKSYGGVGASLGAGVAPTWTALGRLLFVVHNGHWLFELGAEGSLPATGRLDTGERFSQRLFLGTAAACAERGALVACAVAKLGGITVRGIDVDKSNSPTGFVAQVGPRLGGSYQLGDHVGLHARIDGLFLLTPWTVELNQVAAWTMPRFGVSTGIDLSIRIE